MRRTMDYVRMTTVVVVVVLVAALAAPVAASPARQGSGTRVQAGTAQAFSLSMVTGQVNISGAAAPLALKQPTTLSGNLDTGDGGTGAVSGGRLSTPTISFSTTAAGAPVDVDATFSQTTAGSGTGSVDAAGNVAFNTSLKAQLRLEIGGPDGLIQDCATSPVNVSLGSDAPYDTTTGRVTVRDADFSIPPVSTSATCISQVASGVNDLLAGSGNSLVMTLDGALTLPPAPGCPSITTVSVPSATSYQGNPIELAALVIADPAGAGTAECADAGGAVPTGSVEFRSGGTVVGVAPLDGSGAAQLVTTDLPSGSAPITARYRGEPPYAASTSTAVDHRVVVKPAIVADVPSGFTIGAAPVAFDVQASNTGLGGEVVNARLDMTISSGAGNPMISPDMLALERFDGTTWVPVPLQDSRFFGVYASIGPANGVPLAVDAEITQQIRLAATNAAKPLPMRLTFELVPVDPGTGLPAVQVGSAPSALAHIEVASLLTNIDRPPAALSIFALAPHTLRQGMTERVQLSLATSSGGVQPTGTFQVLLDGVAVPSRTRDMDPALGYVATVPAGSSPMFVIPADARTGTREVTVRYSGDAFYAPALVSGTITVLPSLGTTYECINSTAFGTTVFNADITAHANLPASVKAGAPLRVSQLDVRLRTDRDQAVDQYGNNFGPTNPVLPPGSPDIGMTGVDFDFGNLGSGTADAVTFANNIQMRDDTRPVDLSPDQVIGFEGESATLAVSGAPGDVVPVKLETVQIDAFLGISYPLTCTAVGDPISLGTVTVAGTTLTVDAPSPARVGDAVTLRAAVEPAGTAGTVEFRDGTRTLAVVAAGSDGSASYTSSNLLLGDHSLTAVFRGATTAVSSSSAVAQLRILAASQCLDQAVAGNRAFLRLAFLEVLDRCPSGDRADYWTGQLDGGLSKSSFATTITNSPEATGEVVDDAYQQILGRNPAAQLRPGRVAEVRKSGSTRLLATLAGSDELWAQAGATNGGYIDLVYARLEGRAAPTTARATWVAFLAGGGSRRDLATFVAVGPNALAQTVTLRYQDLLGRAPDARALAARVRTLQADGRRSKLDAALVGSDEFARRAGTFPNPGE